MKNGNSNVKINNGDILCILQLFLFICYYSTLEWIFFSFAFFIFSNVNAFWVGSLNGTKPQAKKHVFVSKIYLSFAFRSKKWIMNNEGGKHCKTSSITILE